MTTPVENLTRFSTGRSALAAVDALQEDRSFVIVLGSALQPRWNRSAAVKDNAAVSVLEIPSVLEPKFVVLRLDCNAFFHLQRLFQHRVR